MVLTSVDATDQEALKRYVEIRTTGREMYQKIGAGTGKSFSMIHAAKRMGLPVVGRTLVFDSELDMAALHDFWLHEFRPEGQSLLNRPDPAREDLTELEMEILHAARASRTSLFEVNGVDPGFCQIRLRDLLEPEQEDIWLTDIQFSRSMADFETGPVVFLRVLRVSGITMSSGFFFPFRPRAGPGLVQAYRQKMKRVPLADLSRERFAFFYGKYRKIGAAGALDEAWDARRES